MGAQPSEQYLDRETLKQLSVLSPWRTGLTIAGDWLVIAAMIALSKWNGSWLVYFAAIIVIAGRMHALGVLIHDFAHYRFLKNKRLSEWIGDIFLAWPILITVDSYRTTHLEHHKHTNTKDDPDFVDREGHSMFTFPASRLSVAFKLTGYLLVWRTIADVFDFHMKKIARKRDRFYVFARIAFYLGVIALTWITDTRDELLFYWVIPFLTLFFAIMYIRAVAEHFCDMDYSGLESGTRTVIPHAWERLFFAPHNVNYHIEHHLYPGVPFYRLPELHEALMADPRYRARAHITRGYTTGLLRECLGFVRQNRPARAVAEA